jgi:hypothetical protein
MNMVWFKHAVGYGTVAHGWFIKRYNVRGVPERASNWKATREGSPELTRSFKSLRAAKAYALNTEAAIAKGEKA